MKTMKILLLILSFVILPLGCKKQDSGTSSSADANQVKEEISEAAEATGTYLNEQKEAILKKANTTYDQLKNDTQQLMADMKEAGKENWQKLSSNLDSKLNATQQKLAELKEAGDENLQKTNNAFNTAIEELKDAYQKAKAEYQKTGEEN